MSEQQQEQPNGGSPFGPEEVNLFQVVINLNSQLTTHNTKLGEAEKKVTEAKTNLEKMEKEWDTVRLSRDEAIGKLLEARLAMSKYYASIAQPEVTEESFSPGAGTYEVNRE